MFNLKRSGGWVVSTRYRGDAAVIDWRRRDVDNVCILWRTQTDTYSSTKPSYIHLYHKFQKTKMEFFQKVWQSKIFFVSL